MAVPNQPPENLQISFYLYKNYDLWIWDFDDTLIDTTTYYIKSMEREDILNRKLSELDREIPCWQYYKNLVMFLTSTGKRVGIASFGTYEIIKAYMDKIFGVDQKFFTRANIKALNPSGMDINKIPPNKNAYIYELMEFYRIQDFERVVLFDDFQTNIADANAIGVLGIKIKGRDQNGIGNARSLFCPDIMEMIDYMANKSCGKDIYNRRVTGGIGNRKAKARDKQFLKVRYIYPNRFFNPYDMKKRELKELRDLLEDTTNQNKINELRARINTLQREINEEDEFIQEQKKIAEQIDRDNKYQDRLRYNEEQRESFSDSNTSTNTSTNKSDNLGFNLVGNLMNNIKDKKFIIIFILIIIMVIMTITN